MAGVLSCALCPGGAQFGPPCCHLLEPQVLEMAAVGWPPSNGRHGHPLGPVHVPGLLVGQAIVPDRAILLGRGSFIKVFKAPATQEA